MGNDGEAMKNADDWAEDFVKVSSDILRSDAIQIIKQIQLDAWAQGVVNASEVASGYLTDDAYSIREYIECEVKPPKELC